MSPHSEGLPEGMQFPGPMPVLDGMSRGHCVGAALGVQSCKMQVLLAGVGPWASAARAGAPVLPSGLWGCRQHRAVPSSILHMFSGRACAWVQTSASHLPWHLLFHLGVSVAWHSFLGPSVVEHRAVRGGGTQLFLKAQLLWLHLGTRRSRLGRRRSQKSHWCGMALVGPGLRTPRCHHTFSPARVCCPQENWRAGPDPSMGRPAPMGVRHLHQVTQLGISLALRCSGSVVVPVSQITEPSHCAAPPSCEAELGFRADPCCCCTLGSAQAVFPTHSGLCFLLWDSFLRHQRLWDTGHLEHEPAGPRPPVAVHVPSCQQPQWWAPAVLRLLDARQARQPPLGAAVLSGPSVGTHPLQGRTPGVRVVQA